MNTDGLMKINFQGEDVRSEYFVVRRQDY